MNPAQEARRNLALFFASSTTATYLLGIGFIMSTYMTDVSRSRANLFSLLMLVALTYLLVLGIGSLYPQLREANAVPGGHCCSGPYLSLESR